MSSSFQPEFIFLYLVETFLKVNFKTSFKNTVMCIIILLRSLRKLFPLAVLYKVAKIYIMKF